MEKGGKKTATPDSLFAVGRNKHYYFILTLDSYETVFLAPSADYFPKTSLPYKVERN